MSLSITHKFISSIPDSLITTVVNPSNWNDVHIITGSLNTPYYLKTSDYNYTPLSSASSLAIGANTINLTTIPLGIAVGGTAYISGGFGTIEVVPVIGVGSNYIIVTCAYTHTGAWTIKSATAGIQEALAAAGGVQPVYVDAGISTTYTTITISGASASLFGAIFAQEQLSTVIQAAHPGHIFTVTGLSNKTFVLKDMFIKGTGSNGDGIHMDNCHTWVVERLWITNNGGHGFYKFQCYGGVERDCGIVGNQKHGSFLQQCNAILIDRPTYNGNGLDGAGNHGGITIDGQSNLTTCKNITVRDGSVESNGFGASGVGVSALYANNLVIEGTYFEANVVYNIFIDTTVNGFSLNGIFSLGNQMAIGGVHGKLSGTTFQGGTNGLQFSGTDQDIDFSGCYFVATPAVGYGTSGVYYRDSASKQLVYYIGTETGANNALVATVPVTLVTGLRLVIKLAHSLQAGANTLNGVAIKSSRNPTNNLGVALASTGTIQLFYDSTGPYYLDLSQ